MKDPFDLTEELFIACQGDRFKVLAVAGMLLMRIGVNPTEWSTFSSSYVMDEREKRGLNG